MLLEKQTSAGRPHCLAESSRAELRKSLLVPLNFSQRLGANSERLM